MAPDLLPARSAISHLPIADETTAKAAYGKLIFHGGSPNMQNTGDFGLELLSPQGRFDCLGTSELNDLMSRYAEERAHGPVIFNRSTHEVEQETAPTSKLPADMIVQLLAMPRIVNTLNRFEIIDDPPSMSEMIAWHTHSRWPKLSAELAASHGAAPQESYMPLLATTAAPWFKKEILAAPDPVESLETIAQLRELLAQAMSRYEQLDHTARLEHLRETAAALGKREPLDLLASLADERGLSWQTISTMLGVSSSAVRKWRRGASVAPENREQIAALVAFFEQTDEIREPIAEIGGWMEMRVREDTTLTPAVIYAAGPGHRWLLLEWMRGYLDATVMLDRFDDSWRERYARDPNFQVVETEAGERAIVPR